MNRPGLPGRARALLRRACADFAFRFALSLRCSFAFNLSYALFKLWAGVVYASYWSAAIAVYYLLLAAARFSLLCTAQAPQGAVPAWRQYRFCGWFLLALDLPLAGITLQMVLAGQGYRYPGTLIYAAALYVFYSLGAALVSLWRCHKLNSPLWAAAKALNLAVALVSILSLQTAMFAAFGGGEAYERGMTAATGAGVCLLIAGMAVFMMLRAGQTLTCLKAQT